MRNGLMKKLKGKPKSDYSITFLRNWIRVMWFWFISSVSINSFHLRISQNVFTLSEIKFRCVPINSKSEIKVKSSMAVTIVLLFEKLADNTGGYSLACTAFNEFFGVSSRNWNHLQNLFNLKCFPNNLIFFKQNFFNKESQTKLKSRCFSIKNGLYLLSIRDLQGVFITQNKYGNSIWSACCDGCNWFYMPAFLSVWFER